MTGILDFAYAAKAWIAGLVTVVGAVVTDLKLAVADDAISFTEAEGIALLVVQAVTFLLSVSMVFRRDNVTRLR